MPSPPETPATPPVRLSRETPFRSQIGCTLFLAVLLLAFAAFAFVAGTEPGKNQWVPWVVGAMFGLFGLLLLLAFVRQWAARHMGMTLVEVSAEPLLPGKAATFCVIQPGPAKLKSLRASLVCTEITLVPLPHAPAGRSDHRREERILSTETLISAGHLHVLPGRFWIERRDYSLPADAPVSSTVGKVTVVWRIEVWGKGYGLASFMHPFPVDVFHHPRPRAE
jgi:hypothetical protein